MRMSNDEINRVIEDHNNRHCDRFEIYQHKKINKRARKVWLGLAKERIIERATELSETGIPTLESVKAVIKESEDEWEKTYKKSLKRGSSAPSIIAIWAVISFLLTLAINLAFWGVITSSTSLQKGYWVFLFTEGLWTFLVGGIGAAVIMLLLYLEDIF